MHIICARDTLIEGLGLVGRTVSTRSTLPILECILLTAESDSGLRLTANDLEMSIETASLSAEIIEEGSVALDARLFTEIARKMPGESIEIKTDSNYLTKCTSGRARFQITGLPGDEFPVMQRIEKTDCYKLSAKVLKDMIKQTIFSVAVDETKPILTGELLQYRDNSAMVAVAVDGFRISYRSEAIRFEPVPAAEGEDAEKRAPMKVVVPAKSLNELSRILPGDGEDEANFYFTDKRIVFELPRFTVVSRLLEGEFIRYDQIFNEDFTTIVTTERISFLTGLERACLIARDAKKSPVKLTIQDESLIITSNTEMGHSYDEIACDIDGQNMEIAFNPRYLIESLRAIEEDKVIIKLTTPLSPCIIRGLESDAFKYLILPLRLRS